MARADRLLALIDALRRRRAPVSGQTLAAELGVSVRTVYRDIAALKAQGATVDGEAGVGFVLRPGFLLPPLMLSEDEVDAVALGLEWVATRADAGLASAAANARAKLAAVVPSARRVQVEESGLLVPPGAVDPAAAAVIRDAIRRERKVRITYRDAGGAPTARTIWPVAIGYFEAVRVAVAWCELRAAFRHFRIDRIADIEALPTRIPRRRVALAKQWRAEMAAEAATAEPMLTGSDTAAA